MWASDILKKATAGSKTDTRQWKGRTSGGMRRLCECRDTFKSSSGFRNARNPGTRSLCRRKLETGIVPRQWRERVQSLIDFAADIRGTVLRYLRDDKKETVAKPISLPSGLFAVQSRVCQGPVPSGFGCKARDGLPFLVQHSSQEGKQGGMKATPRAKGQFCVHNL
ncbi:hypothetical protein CIHG_02432 [Coccidioides immitis H538.4]|uniref:Uncharacterized protein n=2 Tax=Coccidioides immitis TaxID=5501 RepID=A0A0J8RJ07_COCIT|nr:hypothetical protein CIRG_00596 [Coccidioides immitis RMSCC 2394]KMU84646.1 hypothetical protein CIHG_02432 [Coccidioides immitis H538.4]